jgi:hypothetical protein
MSSRKFATVSDESIFKSVQYKPDWNPERTIDRRFTIGTESDASSRRTSYNSVNASPLTSYAGTRRNSVNPENVASAGVSALGAATLAFPALAPVAAAAGIGYGIYKLGDSLNLW